MKRKLCSRSAYRLFLMVLAAAHVLLHTSWSVASTFGGPYQIKSVIVGGYGAHVEVFPAPSGCTDHWEGTQFVVLREQVNYKDLLAGLLAAQAQGKAIMAWFDPQGNGTCGFSNQQIINAIQIKN
jgi:hypothetical protein